MSTKLLLNRRSIDMSEWIDSRKSRNRHKIALNTLSLTGYLEFLVLSKASP